MLPALVMTWRRVFDPEVLAQLPALADQFAAARPFPHAVIDGLFDDALLAEAAGQFPAADDPRWEHFLTPHEDKLAISNSEQHMPPAVLAILRELNAERFLHHVAAVTRIQGLIPDPYLGGGGMHCVRRGGRLGIHADFNFHPYLLLARRANLLVYLNRDWPDEYGGHLELWDHASGRCVQRIAPAFNRTVLFLTDRHSLHGHPLPLACPPERVRKSLALYYYTAPDIAAYRHALEQHGTLFTTAAQ
jgi:Rps23 Pro-64 3,4-dihydroxylase Tpa1-like proline 4-hydroxylase